MPLDGCWPLDDGGLRHRRRAGRHRALLPCPLGNAVGQQNQHDGQHRPATANTIPHRRPQTLANPHLPNIANMALSGYAQLPQLREPER
jgi:hypothetical protein